jgi:hypothetical protein
VLKQQEFGADHSPHLATESRVSEAAALFPSTFNGKLYSPLHLMAYYLSTNTCLPAELFFSLVIFYIQSVPGGKVNILGGHSIGYSKQKSVYVHMSYPEWFSR